jgi:hypothetical protein
MNCGLPQRRLDSRRFLLGGDFHGSMVITQPRGIGDREERGDRKTEKWD